VLSYVHFNEMFPVVHRPIVDVKIRLANHLGLVSVVWELVILADFE
jgi:hypothetical protein